MPTAEPAPSGPWIKYQRAPQAAGLFDGLIPPANRSATAQQPAGPWTKYQRPASQQPAPAPMGARVIEFEGRRIEVPSDATDAEIRGILEQKAGPFDDLIPQADGSAPQGPRPLPTSRTAPARSQNPPSRSRSSRQRRRSTRAWTRQPTSGRARPAALRTPSALRSTSLAPA